MNLAFVVSLDIAGLVIIVGCSTPVHTIVIHFGIFRVRPRVIFVDVNVPCELTRTCFSIKRLKNFVRSFDRRSIEGLQLIDLFIAEPFVKELNRDSDSIDFIDDDRVNWRLVLKSLPLIEAVTLMI